VIAWMLLAPLWYDEIIVLGYKCRTVACVEPARWLVWWPGPEPIRCCESCTAYWKNVGWAMGFTPATEALPRFVPADDDSATRFSLLELE